MSLAKTVTIPGADAGHTLEGRLTRSAQACAFAVIAPPHPLSGGSIGNPVVRAVERALQALGLATLAFNFRGAGESSGEPSGELEHALADFRAATRAIGDLPLAWLAGYSFGSIAALSLSCELGVPQTLLVAPPLALLDRALPARYAGRLLITSGAHDEYAPPPALREAFAAHPNHALEVVEDVDHFFYGSGAQRLSATLERLLAHRIG